MLEVQSLQAGYGPIRVVWDVSFALAEGEIVTLLGANGAGKSTTIKTIAGVLRAQGGSVRFRGSRIDTLPAHHIVEAGLVQIPEGRQVWGELSVHDNIELGAYARRARGSIDTSLEWVYSLFPVLRERRRALARDLSGGQQQMLAIARALMSKPKLLMLDEPSLGLAPRVVEEVFEILLKINDENISVLLVEQNVDFALQVADRAYVLEQGRVVREGASKDLHKSDDIRAAYLGR